MNAITDTTAVAPVAAPTAADTIICKIDGKAVHSIQLHIDSHYKSEWTLARYSEEFPGEPILSPFAQNLLDKRKAQAAAPASTEKASAPSPMLTANLVTDATGTTGVASADAFAIEGDTGAMHDIFGFGQVPAAMSRAGNPVPVRTFKGHGAMHLPYLEEVDPGYVFDISLTKKIIVGLALRKPLYLWGMHGTGKTSALQQVSARTKRPVMRVQHSIGMQESEVLGQYVVRNGATEFQLGPLPMAMLYGWLYIADEYDFAMPSVTALYQPVLEGQPLLIKDAPLHLRKIVPHEDFRFAATGNTNGCGDETGLYQGTMMQNAANYSRFGVTEEVHYMDEKTEVAILRAKAGMPEREAKKMVDFANKIRQAFRDSKISMTVSLREIINAGQLGLALGGDWREGLCMSFTNRLPRVDQKVANDTAQRIFGQ